MSCEPLTGQCMPPSHGENPSPMRRAGGHILPWARLCVQKAAPAARIERRHINVMQVSLESLSHLVPPHLEQQSQYNWRPPHHHECNFHAFGPPGAKCLSAAPGIGTGLFPLFDCFPALPFDWRATAQIFYLLPGMTPVGPCIFLFHTC